MKIQMNDILALCFLVMLFVGTAGSSGIKCLGCSNVGPDNKCKTKPYECTAGKWKFCFTRITTKMRRTVKVQRGCTSFCKSESRIKGDYNSNTWCCYRERCNSFSVYY